uniref:Uncharacterized protein n=1 Tax=Mola mola TaxID=94237 RepID=A0A3Q3WX57_MOLML
ALKLSICSCRSDRSASSITHMSLLPWTYFLSRKSFVTSLLPQRISHAQCLTSGCLSLPGGENDISHLQHLMLVKYEVQRQKNKGGREVDTVSCTCVRPTVIPQP